MDAFDKLKTAIEAWYCALDPIFARRHENGLYLALDVRRREHKGRGRFSLMRLLGSENEQSLPLAVLSVIFPPLGLLLIIGLLTNTWGRMFGAFTRLFGKSGEQEFRMPHQASGFLRLDGGFNRNAAQDMYISGMSGSVLAEALYLEQRRSDFVAGVGVGVFLFLFTIGVFITFGNPVSFHGPVLLFAAAFGWTQVILYGFSEAMAGTAHSVLGQRITLIASKLKLPSLRQGESEILRGMIRQLPMVGIAIFVGFGTLFYAVYGHHQFGGSRQQLDGVAGYVARNYMALWFTFWLLVLGILCRWLRPRHLEGHVGEARRLIADAGVYLEMALVSWEARDADMDRWFLEQGRRIPLSKDP